jgi:hypothetical protein
MSSHARTLRITAEIAEFMLDLPEGTAITGASFSDGKVILITDSEFEFAAEVVDLVYSNDEYGNSALVGSVPA